MYYFPSKGGQGRPICGSMAMSSPQDFRIDQETVSERQDGGRDGEDQQWHYLKIDSKFASYQARAR